MKLSSANTAFPPGSLVLVTGASGFIATHIIDQLLLAGYKVRGTVRGDKKAAWTAALFAERHGAGKFSVIIVPDMSTEGAFDEAVKGVQGVIHTASVLSFSPDPNAVIPPTIAGVTNLLRSASKEQSIKSFVYTSSSTACAGVESDLNDHFSIDASTWNDSQIKEAWSITSEPFPPNHAAVVYGASKAEAEKALWKYVKDEKPHFQINTILPDLNFGEVLSLQGSLSSGSLVRMVHESGIDFVKELPPQWYVDVIDTARIHVAALLCKSISNERIFAFAEPFTWNDVLAVLRKLHPSKKFADDIPNAEWSKMKVPTERGAELLKDVFGREGWTSLEETVAENVKDLI